MNKNSTLTLKCILIALISTLFFSFAQAQTAPKLKFRQPQLVSGIDGTIGAMYKFANVTDGVDAFVSIEDIKNGAILVNIDDSTIGYYDAWQPTVGGPNAVGSSYIKWNIDFKTSDGSVYTFATLDATAVDVDGDNASINEFIGVNGQSGYSVPTEIPTLLTVISLNDTDNVKQDNPGATTLWAIGPITNRMNIDTSSEDVRINYDFANASKIKFYTGSTVGAPDGAVNRYHSIYFMDIQDKHFNVLPVTYRTFDATIGDATVNLSWTTDAKISNDHFEVERSFDQTNFSTIGIILGAQAGNGASEQYNFKDDAPGLAGHTIIYYRLKQVNVAGEINYSVVKTLRTKKAVTKAFVQVSPNPYMDRLNVNFVSDASGSGQVTFINASGSVIKITASAVTKGYNTIQLQNLQSQPAGLYVANVTINGKEIASLKVLKQ